MQKSVIRKMTRRDGDAVVAEWTPGVEAEEEVARDTFDSLVGGGFAIFQATPGVKPEGPVRTFNPQAKEYIVAPRFKGG